MFKLLKIIARAGEATEKYPFAPMPVSPGFRGKPEYTSQQCIACAACVLACPPNALTVKTDADACTRTWSLNLGRCIFCGRCEEVCPTGAIELSPEFELAVGSKADLLQQATFTLMRCRQCDTPFAPTKEVEYALALTVQQGVPESDLESLRARFETCPDCKRLHTLDATDARRYVVKGAA
ncbi:formate hydrogenlyase complex iron-sulfur subunit [Uliginosibacterium sp. sgz301328]|uniref:formate hydrogenlyase complex iron-sulfur subunit n=1 Tax=Uliginosibacterium sp. sgz301328 TaxID=3243764 RepID=UPI00359E37EA